MELLGLAGWGLPVCEAIATDPQQKGTDPRRLDCSSEVHSPAWEKQQLAEPTAAPRLGSMVASRAQYTSCAKWCVSSSSAEGLWRASTKMRLRKSLPCSEM